MVSFAVVVDRFNKYLYESQKSPRTIEAYTLAVRTVLTPVQDDWTDYARVHRYLQDWRNRLIALRIAKVISAERISVPLAGLRAFFKYAKMQQLITHDPTDEIIGPAPAQRLPRPMSLEDLRRLFAVLPDGTAKTADEWRDRALIECFFNGLRSVEACRLNIRDIQFKPEVSSLVAELCGKRLSLRSIVINQDSASFLSAYLLERFLPGKWREYIRPGVENSSLQLFNIVDEFVLRNNAFANLPVFVDRETRLRRNQVNIIFRKYRSLSGISNRYGPHTLRHTCATQLLEADQSLAEIQEILGHKHIQQTILYTKVVEQRKAKAISRLPTMGAAF